MFLFRVFVLMLNVFVAMSAIMHDSKIAAALGILGTIIMIYKLTEGDNA